MALPFFLPTYVTLLGFTAFLVYVLVNYVISYRKLRQFKGPFLASLSQYWLFKATLDGRVSPAGADVLKKYGEALRCYNAFTPQKLIPSKALRPGSVQTFFSLMTQL